MSLSFTPRQRDVLSHLQNGLGNREIARRLGVSEADVKAIVARMLRRAGLRTRAALAAAAAVMDVTGLDVLPTVLHRQLLRRSPLMLAVLEGPEHEFVFANERFAERAARPLIGRRLMEVFADPHGVTLADRAFAHGETVSEPGFRARWLMADGARETITDLVVHPLRDERGSVGAVAFFLLETADPDGRLRLGAAERAILEAAPAGVVVVDASRTVVLANARSLEVLGLDEMPRTLDDLHDGRPIRDPATGRALRADDLPSCAALRGGDCATRRVELVLRDGTARSLVESATALRSAEGAVTGAMLLLTTVADA